MRPKLVRDLVTLATFVAVWFVAPSAFARTSSEVTLASIVSFVSPMSTSTPDKELSTEPEQAATSRADEDRRNAAPLCDPRGATMFAPAPQLQDVEQSLDVTESCSREDELRRALGADGHQVERHRAPGSGGGETASHEPTIASRALVIGRGEGVRVPAPDADRERSRPGHRTPLDRPPRA